jgi:signal transduction histidine kinase
MCLKRLTRPMRKHTLARRLARTYVLLTIVVGAVLSLASLWTVNTLEDHLQAIDMGLAVGRVRDDFLAGKEVGRADRFFHGQAGSDAFPDWLKSAPPGFSKLEHDGRTWHVMTDDGDGARYMLLRDYTAFERSQQYAHWLTVGGVAAALALAFVLGGVITRGFVRPLRRLAEQVGERPDLPLQTRLAKHYPDDEIGQLATAFDETYNQLEAALQREKLFTADVGHELRTPLMVISSTCELLLDDAYLQMSQRTQVQRIHAATKEIDQQLAAYLMLARGRDESDGFARTDTVSAVNEQVSRWAPRARQLGLVLEAKYSNAEETQAADIAATMAATVVPMVATAAPTYPAALLRIVLSNLIRNALQHALDGTCIRVIATPTSLQVSDDGPGIPASAQSGIFAPFVRGGRASADNLGLGLSLVQRICQHQGWHVSLASTPETGTRFHVELVTRAASLPD